MNAHPVLRSFSLTLLFLILFPCGVFAQSDLLSKEESLWLASRNNTIIVYPEKNFPPFSYQSSAGTPQGLSVDYIELIAKKVGAKVVYLPARPVSQILDDVRSGKADVITSITDTPEREQYLLFSDTYVTIPTVIVTRKDYDANKTTTLNDFSGKEVAVTDGRAVEGFIRQNYPRVVVAEVTDDEIALQQLVLGEVDAAVMDVATLSFYLSKQTLNSVKIVGNVGFEYKFSFATTKDKGILQSILDKGLAQVSVADRSVLSDKWVSFQNKKDNDSFIATVEHALGGPVFYTLLLLGFGAILFGLGRRYGMPYYHRRSHRTRALDALEEKIDELHESEAILSEEMDEIKKLEKSISSKIEDLNQH